MAAKAVREAGYFDTRIINAHTHLVQPADIPLFAKYNVLANTSSIWHYDAPEAESVLGSWRYRHQFALQSILQHGARMTLGSDFPADEMGNEPLRACLISRRVWIGEWIFCPARQKSAGILTDGKDF